MAITKLKTFTAKERSCSDYFVGKDEGDLNLYLFRKIQDGEEKWYLNKNNKNFYEELMAVRLHEVKSLEQGRQDTEVLWKNCKMFIEKRKGIT